MGCFFACFGFAKKRKRRKTSSIITSEFQSYGRYVPLDSDVSVKLEVDEMPNPKASAAKLSDKPKEPSKEKKKVSFNLNVKTYEPLPNEDEDSDTYLSEGEEKTMWEFNQEENAATSTLQFEEDLISSRTGSFPANYRYQNCRSSYDEEDEIELYESELDDDDLKSDREDDSQSGENETQKLSSASEERKSKADQLQAAAAAADLEEKNRKKETNQSGRNRSQNVYSVLNPVENLTQWKAIKAKSRQQLKHQKENSVSNLNHSKPMMHGIAVDASLSNWMS